MKGGGMTMGGGGGRGGWQRGGIVRTLLQTAGPPVQ